MATTKQLLDELEKLQDELGVIWQLEGGLAGEMKFSGIVYAAGSNDYRWAAHWTRGNSITEVMQGMIDKFKERYGYD